MDQSNSHRYNRSYILPVQSRSSPVDQFPWVLAHLSYRKEIPTFIKSWRYKIDGEKNSYKKLALPHIKLQKLLWSVTEYQLYSLSHYVLFVEMVRID